METRRNILKIGAAAAIAGTADAQILAPKLSPSVTGFMQSAGQTLATNVLNGNPTAEQFHTTATAFQLYMAQISETGGTPGIEQSVKAFLAQKTPLSQSQLTTVYTAAQKASGVSLSPAQLAKLATAHYTGFAPLTQQFTTLGAANGTVVQSLNAAAQYAPLMRKAQGENLGNFCFYASWVTTYISIVVWVAGVADTILIPVGVALLWLC